MAIKNRLIRDAVLAHEGDARAQAIDIDGREITDSEGNPLYFAAVSEGQSWAPPEERESADVLILSPRPVETVSALAKTSFRYAVLVVPVEDGYGPRIGFELLEPVIEEQNEVAVKLRRTGATEVFSSLIG